MVPAASIYVGDSPSDGKAARAAGMKVRRMQRMRRTRLCKSRMKVRRTVCGECTSRLEHACSLSLPTAAQHVLGGSHAWYGVCAGGPITHTTLPGSYSCYRPHPSQSIGVLWGANSEAALKDDFDVICSDVGELVYAVR